MDFTGNFWDIILWTLWVFVWITAIFIWFRCVFDMFSDRTLSGWAKVGWSLVLIFLPWLGAFIYIVTRGRTMGERQMAAAAQQQAAQDEYIRQVASASASPTDQVANAKSLLDSGAITQDEFDRLKVKALA
jgi:hypothetical protein